MKLLFYIYAASQVLLIILALLFFYKKEYLIRFMNEVFKRDKKYNNTKIKDLKDLENMKDDTLNNEYDKHFRKDKK